MKILHVSDIHYRASPKNSALLEQAAQQFEQLQPDYILITGDLSRDGLIEQFAHMKHFLNSLNFCHVLIIPGNRDIARKGSHKGKRVKAFLENFGSAEFFYRDAYMAAIGLNSTPEITPQQMEATTHHFRNGPPSELRIFCAHHTFLPVPTKKLKEDDIVPRAADILQTLIELNVDLLCCGHIHRSHVWDLSDGGHRLLCCNAGSLLDTSGKKDNGYLEIEIEHDLRITKHSLFTDATELLYQRQHFSNMLQNRQQILNTPQTSLASGELSKKASEEHMKSKKERKDGK